MTLKTQGLQTLEQIRAFLEGTQPLDFQVSGRWDWAVGRHDQRLLVCSVHSIRSNLGAVRKSHGAKSHGARSHIAQKEPWCQKRALVPGLTLHTRFLARPPEEVGFSVSFALDVSVVC